MTTLEKEKGDGIYFDNPCFITIARVYAVVMRVVTSSVSARGHQSEPAPNPVLLAFFPPFFYTRMIQPITVKVIEQKTQSLRPNYCRSLCPRSTTQPPYC